MRKLFLLPAAAMLFLAACNSGNSSKDGSDTISVSTAADSSANTDTVAALPAVSDSAKVFFKNLKDGQTVSSPLTIQFGQIGVLLAPKGEVVANSGHHHLIIDGDSIPKGQVIPADSTHIHYGKAQTEGTITLTPGKHTLTLQYGDGIHRSYGSKLSSTINVIVK